MLAYLVRKRKLHNDDWMVNTFDDLETAEEVYNHNVRRNTYFEVRLIKYNDGHSAILNLYQSNIIESLNLLDLL